MRVQRFTRYGLLGGVLAVLACGGNSARTDDTVVARDTTAMQDTSGYRAMTRDTMSRDTSVVGMTDSAKSSRAKSGTTEIKPGESTVGMDSTGVDSMQMRPDQSQPVTAKGDTLRTGSDTTTK